MTKLCECGCGNPAPIAKYSVAWKGWIKGEPKRFVSGHNKGLPAEYRFWAKVERKGNDECWPWQGAKDSRGYGNFMAESRASVKAYRFAYELLVGPIPEGLCIDHLCRNPSCCNPAHMEPVTTAENLRRGEGASAVNARKTHCLRGHPFSEDNTRMEPSGKRRCLTCERERGRRRSAQLREAS